MATFIAPHKMFLIINKFGHCYYKFNNVYMDKNPSNGYTVVSKYSMQKVLGDHTLPKIRVDYVYLITVKSLDIALCFYIDYLNFAYEFKKESFDLLASDQCLLVAGGTSASMSNRVVSQP